MKFETLDDHWMIILDLPNFFDVFRRFCGQGEVFRPWTSDVYLGESAGVSWTSAWEIFWPPKTKMTMEKQPFEDVSTIKNADFPASHVSLKSKSYQNV